MEGCVGQGERPGDPRRTSLFAKSKKVPVGEVREYFVNCSNALESRQKINPSLNREWEHQEFMNDRLVLVHNLNQPGLAVDDVAVGNGGFGDLVPAGLAVGQVNESVCVGDVGTGVIRGAVRTVGGTEEADIEGNTGQRLAGGGIQLPNQKSLLGSVEELDVDNPVTVRCDGHILPGGTDRCRWAGP